MLSIIALLLYVVAAGWLVAGLRHGSPSSLGQRNIGLLFSLAAAVLHAVVLWQGVAAKPSFALSIAETASLVGLGIALIAMLMISLRPRFSGASAVFFVLAGLVAAATNEGTRTFLVEHGGWELTAHIALSVLAYSLITIGTMLAVALTLLDGRLRRREPLGWLAMLPPVDSLESGMFGALAAGFVALSLALFSGFFFVDNIFAQSLSRKIALSCVAWAILAVLLFGRWRFGWRGKRARNWTIGGFVVLGLAYFGSKIVLESILGRHWG